MKFKVLLVGAGQLGSRYLQGLARCNLPLDILVIDPSPESLDRARSRWLEVSFTALAHSVSFKQEIKNVAGFIDLAIIATNAGGRVSIIQGLSTHLKIGCWVIEKVLAQSESELDLISSVLSEKVKAWVNTPRRLMAWHRALKEATPHRAPTTGTVIGGGWGLASNAVQFLDLMAWWTGEKLVKIQTEHLAAQWHVSKRPEYWEVYGTLLAKFSEGSELSLHCTSEPATVGMSLGTQDNRWSIGEVEGIAVRSDGMTLPGRLEFQSEMTGALVESILTEGTCDLPTLAESVALHRPLLKALVAHWNSTMNDQSDRVSIT